MKTKTAASFKLSKTSKRALATVDNRAHRGDIKNIFIDAEVAASVKPKTTRDTNGAPGGGR